MVVVSTGLCRSLQNFDLHKVERSWRSLAFFKMAILKELVRDGNVFVFSCFWLVSGVCSFVEGRVGCMRW